MDYYSFTDPDEMEGWVGLVGWPIADALPTKWSHVNRGSGVDQGKSAGYKPSHLPLSHAANQDQSVAFIHSCVCSIQKFRQTKAVIWT